jgi:hypothetical protein
MSWLNSFKKDPLVDFQLQLVKYSAEAANIHCGKNLSDEVDSRWIAVQFECLYFYLFLTDLNLFNKWGAEKRDKVMDEIGLQTINAALDPICRGQPKDVVEKMKGECIDNFKTRFNEYAKCKIAFHGGERESLKGTLFWEFSKIIAESTGRETNIFGIVNIQLITSQSPVLKEIRKFADNIG